MSLSARQGASVPLLARLDTIGNGSGSHHMVGNYAGAPVLFSHKVPDNQIISLEKIHFMVADTGGMGISEYGNRPALANGIIIAIFNRNGSIKFDFNDSLRRASLPAGARRSAGHTRDLSRTCRTLRPRRLEERAGRAIPVRNRSQACL